MYVPAHFGSDGATRRELLHRPQAADLVTMTADGLVASYLPFLYDETLGERGALPGHLARSRPPPAFVAGPGP